MTKALRMWRTLALVSVAAMSLALVATAFAQEAPPEAPPPLPAQFYGSAELGTAAQVDGADAADGSAVTAWNENGEAVGTDAIEAGTWGIQVSPDDAASVTFSIDGSNQSESFAVTSGSLTAVALALTSAAAPVDDTDAGDMDAGDMDAGDMDAGDMDAPTGLPSTGSGGLADGGGRGSALPLALVAVVATLLGGIALRRRTTLS